METQEFKLLMESKLEKLNIKLSDKQLNQFYDYMNILVEWNKKINLTAITEPNEIILKHFIDSMTVLSSIEENSTIIDVGTGAGFPGIPIKIAYPNTKIILVDSLNKRINFLNDVIQKLELDNIKTIHGRAEDLGTNKEFRETFDYAIARAVAPLNVLTEYLMPFVKVNGKCICMKGPNATEEIENSKNAVQLLGGNVEQNKEIFIPTTEIKRSIVVIKKTSKTSKEYPRKAGIPAKKPL